MRLQIPRFFGFVQRKWSNLGIEALSRGARKAGVCRTDHKAMTCIRENLTFTKLAKQAVLLEMDVVSALKRLEGKYQFDYTFHGSTYRKMLEKQALEYLSASSILSEDAVVIIESSLDTEFSYVEELGFSVIKEKIYKTNKHTLFRKRGLKNAKSHLSGKL